MDSVHAFPPHNASYRLNHLSFFCIYGGLRRQNKQAATDGSHKKAPPPVAGFAKKRTQGNSTSFLSFIRRKAKNPKRQAVFRRAAHASAAGTTRRSSRGLPEIPPSLIHTAQAPDRRACVGKPNAPRPSAQKAVSHTGGVVKGAAESTRVSARPTQTPAKAFSGIAPAPIARPRSDSRNAAGAERPPYSPAELFIDR